ncbi:Ankyrin-2 [Araneus ventricosus]|uniref:Ankyrin-2 n=1 Tax=Araneus ventricosus TaxID=182803 RepID=A0A4Y2VFV5_ARAVE|nr:Ankyrin-2 [Araneus ventricosus]
METNEILKDYNFSSLTERSKQTLLTKFNTLDEVSAKEFYIDILKTVKVSLDKIQLLKHLSWLLNEISGYKSKENLQNYLETAKSRIEHFNIVIIASRSKATDALRHIFLDKNKTLYNLSCKIHNKVISPNDHDEFHHNAFYYAVRSNMTDLLRILIEKWPNNYFGEKLEELDYLMSKSYKELKLRNVSLRKEMELYIQTKILNIRFFHKTPEDISTGNSTDHTKKRVDLVVENIELIKSTYWDSDPDEEFILSAEFIAKNIHVLKSVLKSTYDKLPWEEIEFCLTIFMQRCKKNFKSNLVYNTVLTKKKLLLYLEEFSNVLQSEMENIANGDIKKQMTKRERVVENIIEKNPIFQDLYADYERVRDFCSLETIKDYTNLAVSADPSTEEGKLLVIRALQVIGEHIKNTLTTPKLSIKTAHLLLYSLPFGTREVISKLRDSLLHDNFIVRSEIEKRSCNFFKDIQADISKMNRMTTETLSEIKTGQMKTLLLKLKDCKYWKDVKELLETYNFSIDSIVSEIKKLDYDGLIKNDAKRLQELLSNFFELFEEKTPFESSLFQQIDFVIQTEKKKFMTVKDKISLIIHKLCHISSFSQNVDTDVVFNYDLLPFNFELPDISKPPVMHFSLLLAQQLLNSCISRIEPENVEIWNIVWKIFDFIEFQMGKIKWIKGFFDFIRPQNQKKRDSRKVEIEKIILSSKCLLLKKILKKNNLIDNLVSTNLSVFENRRKFQAVVEMLVLDILSLLDNSCSYNNFFLDNNYILQAGRNLRNDLAHFNRLIHDLSPMASMQLLLNARKLVTENLTNNSRKIDQAEKCDAFELEISHSENLFIIQNQRALFDALSEGNLEKVLECVKEGADIFGKDLKSTSCLHFSAKAPSTEAIKYCLKQGLDINSKDFNDQTALHTAARFNRLEIAEYLLKEGAPINSRDAQGTTPLHIAAENDSQEVVKCLLDHEAHASKNAFGFSPLHSAIFKGKIEAAKILLEKETNVDKIKAYGGFTALYTAAEKGEPEIIRLLIGKKVSIDSRDDFENTPLHVAALNGHSDVVKILISEGADINARNVEGNTPLHGAAKSGNEDIVNLLLHNKANINAKNYHLCIPLHCAAENGYLAIAELFLTADSNLVDAKNYLGLTPLHFAAQKGRETLVKLLLERNATIHSKSSDIDTVLHFSAYYGHLDVVKSLIESGANIEAKENAKNCTPLHMAAHQGHLQIAEFLISKGADIYSRDASGFTSLDIAALRGHKDIVKLLLTKGENFRKIYEFGATPQNFIIFNALSELLLNENANMNLSINDFERLLLLAASFRHQSMINFCLQNGCNVNARDEYGSTALHLATLNNHQDIVTFLLENGADIDAKNDDGNSALWYAASNNGKETVRILINKQSEIVQSLANDRNKALSSAVAAGNDDIVDILFKKTEFDVISLQQNYNFLHRASHYGHRKVAEILLEKGFEIDARWNNRTPLHYAAIYNHCEITRFLISKRANVNAQDGEGKTALHWIAEGENVENLEILLSGGADISIRDNKNQSVAEVAVSSSQLEMIKLLIQKKDIDVNMKGDKGITFLHTSAEKGSLEITEYLTLQGANINAKDMNGSKPIHAAAGKGHKDIVEFYLDKNVNVNDLGHQDFTPLHFAALGGYINVCELLIENGADINALAEDDTTPLHLHLAASNVNEDVVRILLHNGAYYNTRDTSSSSQLAETENKSVDFLIKIIDQLSIAVQNNDSSEVEFQLKRADHPKFSIVNARCVINDTPLLYAAREGYEEIVDILLKFKSNPNIFDKHKLMPLHYAAKSSHLKIVKALLMNGAIYNALCLLRRSPLEYATDQVIIRLLRFAHKVFTKIKNKDNSALKDLKNTKNEQFSKLILRAKDRKGNTLVVAAVLSGFPKTEQLKELFQEDVMHSWKSVTDFIRQRKYAEAVRELKNVLDRRIEIFGLENPAALDIMKRLAEIHLKLHEYDEALNLLHEIYLHMKNIFHEYRREILAVEYLIALTLRRQGKSLEACEIFKSVLKHEELLEKNHSDILFSKIEMALIFAEMGNFAEAVETSNDVFEKSYKKNGLRHETTLYSDYSRAKILSMMGNYSDAIKIFERVYKIQKNLLTSYHVNTLRTQSNIAEMLYELKKYDESIKMFKKILKIQKYNFLENRIQILSNKIHIGKILLDQGMTIAALKIFLALEPKIAKFGPNHFLVKGIENEMKSVSLKLKVIDSEWIIEKIREEMKQDGTKENSEYAKITEVEATSNNNNENKKE